MTVTAVVVALLDTDRRSTWPTCTNHATPLPRLERVTSIGPRLGVTLFLVAAAASFLLSIGLWFAGSREEGVFVGLWVPSILAAGAFWIGAVRRS